MHSPGLVVQELAPPNDMGDRGSEKNRGDQHVHCTRGAAVDVPVFGVYVDGAGTTSTLPNGLQRNRTIAWDWKLIAAAVRQMMGEGKNA
jgi:hypothetical protein